MHFRKTLPVSGIVYRRQIGTITKKHFLLFPSGKVNDVQAAAAAAAEGNNNTISCCSVVIIGGTRLENRIARHRVDGSKASDQ